MVFPHLESLLACATDAAQTAGRHALNHYNRRAEIVRRDAHDVKLQLDLECQERATDVIRRWYPSHTLLGEEGGEPDPSAEVCWVVDPIDGSVNFSHGLPLWCCSIAAIHQNRVLAGAVYLPMLNECFTATMDSPARCNEARARVSATPDLAQSAIALSVTDSEVDEGRSLSVFHELLPVCQKIRALGSAAIDLCYVADGRLDGYVETSIYLWDCAAGGLIVRQAGGRVELLDRPDSRRMRLMASNGQIHDPFRDAVRRGLGHSTGSTGLPDPWSPLPRTASDGANHGDPHA
ncbi:MAG: inositol monophosphatase family protein [Kiritimatiellia bacterium]|nr:inositol monophosphatase family protein [Kiritimatiellia bacterium]